MPKNPKKNPKANNKQTKNQQNKPTPQPKPNNQQQPNPQPKPKNQQQPNPQPKPNKQQQPNSQPKPKNQQQPNSQPKPNKQQQLVNVAKNVLNVAKDIVNLPEKETQRNPLSRQSPYNQSAINSANDRNEKKRPESEHRKNYITVNRFYIEIQSQVRASFTECSGLGVNLKKEIYLEGGLNDQQRIMLGHAEFTDVTLKRGMTDDSEFWKWITSMLAGVPNSRRNVNILLFNQAGETMKCWTLIGAIPISWKAPGFQADGNSVAIEELTLAYEGLQLKTGQGGGGATVDLRRDNLGFFPNN